jgi:hypothetical protein
MSFIVVQLDTLAINAGKFLRRKNRSKPISACFVNFAKSFSTTRVIF